MGSQNPRIVSTIGQGAQGTVLEVKIENKRYALKVYNKEDANSVSAQRRARKIGRVIVKPKTGALNRAWMVDNGEDSNGNPVMLYKLFSNPPIEDYFSSYKPSPKLRIRERIAYGLTAGIVEIHRHGIVHADLAPINVLHSRAGEVAIIDFDGAGYSPTNSKSTHLKPIVQGHVQFPNWVSPNETIDGMSTEKTDVWWLGGLIMKILTGYSPFFFLKFADKPNLTELYSLLGDERREWPPNFQLIKNHSKIQPNLNSRVLDKTRQILNTTITTAVLGDVFRNYNVPAKRPSSVMIWSAFRSRVFR
ncbi:MAG: protein kinase domain-containing protein [Candidatus Kariarchaeaceae archaeon]|jgi:serine/threonine protein kinase